MATIKQEKAVKNLVGNGGNVTKAMRDAEYSENTINTPQKLTESKGFQELWDKVIPDNLLTTVHKEGLEAVRGEEPDYAVRHKYLDSAYKLKGAYAPDKSLNINVDIKHIDPTDPKVLEAMRIINERLEDAETK